jgi:hypothetical protein
MKDHHQKKRVKPPRVELTDRILSHLKLKYPGTSIADLVERSGLPYGLVYNIVNKRVRTISALHYRMLFQESAPPQKQQRVDGAHFREMVGLWLYLNESVTKTRLYNELYNQRSNPKVDYRIFSEKTVTVDVRLVHAMEKKFHDHGIDPVTLEQWLREFGQLDQEDRIAYLTIRPILQFLENELGVHPTTILNQFSDRYERGDLKTVSPRIYDRAVALAQRAKNAKALGDRREMERIKEDIYGEKKGYTLYIEIVDELRFLQRYAKISPKRYLGRGTYMYEKGGCKRIPSWRAYNIVNDCDLFIKSRLDLPIGCLPGSFQRQWIGPLRSLLLARAADMLSKGEGIALEKRILSPVHNKEKYEAYGYGFTQFDRAPSTLGMGKAAFDLMVAKNREIFRTVGRYSQRWYLSDLYLKELSENPYFKLITAKYERLASTLRRSDHSNRCMPPNLA